MEDDDFARRRCVHPVVVSEFVDVRCDLLIVGLRFDGVDHLHVALILGDVLACLLLGVGGEQLCINRVEILIRNAVSTEVVSLYQRVELGIDLPLGFDHVENAFGLGLAILGDDRGWWILPGAFHRFERGVLTQWSLDVDRHLIVVAGREVLL